MLNTRARMVSFYAANAVVLFLLVTKLQKSFLPAALATQIGHNSEAFLFAILVGLEIQILRRVDYGPRRLAITAGGGVVLVILGTLLLHSNLIASLVTLNEPVIGAGLILVYLGLPRSPALGVGLAIATLLFIVVFFSTDLVVAQAESLVPLMLAGLSLEVFDRTILQPDLEDTPGPRLVWMALLVVCIVGFSLAASWARQDLHGPLRLGIDYGQRAAEAYYGWLLIHLYFSFWLGKRWRGDAPVGSHRLSHVSGGRA